MILQETTVIVRLIPRNGVLRIKDTTLINWIRDGRRPTAYAMQLEYANYCWVL